MTRKLNEEEQELVMEIAMRVDVKVYNPVATLTAKLGKTPSIEELANYVAQLRIIEARAVMVAIEALETADDDDDAG